MFFKSATKPTTAELLLLIEEAKNAELCRNIPASQKILRSIWTDFDQDPVFDNFEPLIKAELLRLCGVFLSFLGHARNEKDYQLRAKDLVSASIEIFKQEDLPDKTAEAYVMLALCYWNCGEVEECEDILKTIEEGFSDNQLHPVYMQICVNKMMALFTKGEFQKAVKIVDDLSVSMEFCRDARLLAMYHNQAGIIYRSIGIHDKSEFHLREAIRFARRANNPLFVTINFNNLAFLYKETTNYLQAHECISKAIEGFTALDHKGLIPHALDTKSQIFLDDNKPDEALALIEQVIEKFKMGEDYTGLTGALWTRIRCLFRLNRNEEACLLFTELQEIAAQKIGKSATDKFSKLMSLEVYAPKNLPLLTEVRQFKKFLVKAGVIKIGNNKYDLAKYFGMKKHQTISRIMSVEFPEIYDELGIKRRNSPTLSVTKKTTKPKKEKTKKQNQQQAELENAAPNLPEEKSPRREISWVDTDKNIVQFDFPMRAPDFKTFYISGEQMATNFGIETESLVAVVPISLIEQDLMIIAAEDETFYLGEIQYDKQFDLHVLLNISREPIILDRSNVIGVPIGYCPLSESGGETITFSELEILE
jgi:tetratricopeptide (TPR) repeat protein